MSEFLGEHNVFSSVCYVIQSRIAGSCDNPMFIFLKSCQIIFQSVYMIVHLHQQWMKIAVSLHPHLLLFIFLNIVILVGMKYHHCVDLPFRNEN